MAKVIRYKVSGVLSSFMIAHIFKDKHKVAGGIYFLNLICLFLLKEFMLHIKFKEVEHRAALSLHTPMTPGVGSTFF